MDAKTGSVATYKLNVLNAAMASAEMAKLVDRGTSGQ